jgi:hypothetical protein
MRILSKIKDYYDGCVGVTGIDSHITYPRQRKVLDNVPKEIRACTDGYFESGRYFHHKKYSDISYFLIGFCGKLFIGWKLKEKEYNSLYPTPEEDKITISYDRPMIQELLGHTKNEHSLAWKWGAEKWLDALKKVDDFYNVEIFQELNTPVFLYDRSGEWPESNKLIINPILKDFKFATIIEPFTAFQEISMFLAGALKAGEVDTVTISDEDRQKAHGYDKWSFRNPDPPKRKQKK